MILKEKDTIIDTEIDVIERIPNIHPGEILLEDFMEPLGITAYKLSKETFMTQTKISEIIKGKRAISCNTALKLGRYFSMTPDFWLGLQKDYDLEEEYRNTRIQEELDKIQPIHKLIKK